MSTWPRRLAGDKSKAAMPHHYSAAKYQQSVRLKHRAYEVASKLFEYESWEIIPNDVLQEIDQQAQLRVNKLVQQGQTIVWSLPPDAVQLQAHFRLSEEMTLAARKKRSAVKTQTVGGPTPAELQGYVLTQTLKSGTMLCTAFNIYPTTLTPRAKELTFARWCCNLAELAEVSMQPRIAEGGEPLRPKGISRCNQLQHLRRPRWRPRMKRSPRLTRPRRTSQ
jgi:hypothetical protein